VIVKPGRRTALVTGSTAGIGPAIAEGLAASGAPVVVNGRDPARTRAAAGEVGAATGAADRVTGVAADVGTAAGRDALVRAAPDVDVLVNNAGRLPRLGAGLGDDRGGRARRRRRGAGDPLAGVRQVGYSTRPAAGEGWATGASCASGAPSSGPVGGSRRRALAMNGRASAEMPPDRT
jgi:NAD(P)-dependent dehydrogenase (short-subunit alcohol dehydrogenase family)